MATDGRNLVIYDRNRHERDTALGAWQRRWNVLMRWCVGMLIDMRHADMPFVRCEQEFPYCRRIRDLLASDATVRVGNPDLEYWFFDKSYAGNYMLHGGLHRKRSLDIKVCQRTSARNPLFVGWHNLELFEVPPLERRKYYLEVSEFWREWEPPRLLCVPTPAVFSNYTRAIGDDTPRVSPLFRKIAKTEFFIMAFVCFVRMAEFGVNEMFVPQRLRSFVEERRLPEKY